ncbi:DUF6600 domain-containing protein [Chelatococcus sp. GCM10030263]|uniref:DUF6600 domain-containing protein n=1 Tax=Chelatococcus sp. GCM10030263 TaxID=3273387 RepID=UPI00361A7BA5
MTKSKFLLGAAVSALVLSGAGGTASLTLMLSPAAAQAQSTRVETTTTTQGVSADGFFDRLQPYGELVRVDTLGEVWKPADVPADWKPYSNGQWIYNEEVGWYFESKEPWAEITYHYGRWYDDPNQGWVWVAGTEWAPAWVEWRRSDRYVGWRPLPPDNAPRRTARRSTTTVTQRGAPEETETWVFVPANRIVGEPISRVRIQEDELVQVYRESTVIGSVERRNGYAVNLALRPQMIERGASVRITSQNLPRPDLAPVPDAVRQISTETRSTTRVNRETRQTDGAQPNGTTTGSIRQDGTQDSTRQDAITRQGQNKLDQDQATTTDRTVTDRERTRQGQREQGLSTESTRGTATGPRSTDETAQDDVRMRENGRTRTESTDRATENKGRSTTDQTDRMTGERDRAGATGARQAEERRSTTTSEPRQRANRERKDQDITGSTSPDRQTPANPGLSGKQSGDGDRMGAQPRAAEPADRGGGNKPRADRQDGPGTSAGRSDSDRATGSTSPSDRRSGSTVGQQQPMEPANRNGGGMPRGERRGGASDDDTTGSITPSNRQPGGPQAIPEKIQPGPSGLGQPSPGQSGR